MRYLSGNCSLRAVARQCIKVNPAWSKGFLRKGAALHGLRKYDDAIEAYEAGLKIEESPQLRKALKEVTDAKGEHLSCDCIPFPRVPLKVVARYGSHGGVASHL